jgi:hypothetical protein
MRPGRWRGVALLPAGVFAVHQLRLLLESDGRGGRDIAGHLYIGSLLAWLTIAFAAALGGLIAHLARGLRTGAACEPAASLLRVWAGTAGVLLGLHVLNEALEGLMLGGPGVAGMIGAGGLWALVAAVLVGGVITLLLRGARSLIIAIARRRGLRPALGAAGPRVREPRSVARRPLAPLSSSAAGRAPPLRPRPATA